MHVGMLDCWNLLKVLILILLLKKKLVNFLTLLFPSDFFVANFHQFVKLFWEKNILSQITYFVKKNCHNCLQEKTGV
jgi:hypothetical protein